MVCLYLVSLVRAVSGAANVINSTQIAVVENRNLRVFSYSENFITFLRFVSSKVLFFAPFRECAISR